MDATRRGLVGGGMATGALSAAGWARADDGPPPPAPAAIAPLVGEYGTPDAILTIYESGGVLMADGRGLKTTALKADGGGYAAPGVQLTFQRGTGGRIESVTRSGLVMARRDFGEEVQARIRAGTHADSARLRTDALAATPPVETAQHLPADLVELSTIDPAIKLDIRYAGSDNFMGFPLYERAAAYMQRPAAQAVGRALERLKPRGYGLLIHDAYRPWFVTKMFWEATPPASRMFVADPAEGSRHNRGCAVDLTLYDLASGKPVEMTGRYDEMSQRSYPTYVGGTSRQRWHRELLRSAMEAEGFTVYAQEWWHFDYKDWAQYGIGTATFTELAGRAA
jgi:D-alanyl-D-alanine dipeptidase